ncbi:hypothetical protein [Marinobacter sp.]|uniref:hypothetical protein n=1 Tax=Marinobacter sp. TaxID=50741 RepID=UPI0034431779
MESIPQAVDADKLAVAKDQSSDEALWARVVVPVFFGLHHAQARKRRSRVFHAVVRRPAAFLYLYGPGAFIDQ